MRGICRIAKEPWFKLYEENTGVSLVLSICEGLATSNEFTATNGYDYIMDIHVDPPIGEEEAQVPPLLITMGR